MTDVAEVIITVDEQTMPTVVTVESVTAVPDVVEIYTGMPGPTGPTGPAGSGEGGGGTAGRFFDYLYDPDISGDHPALAGPAEMTTMPEGTLHFDDEDQAAATTVYVSPLTASGVDVSARLAELPVGTQLWIQDRDDSTMHATYTLTGEPLYNDSMGAWVSPVSYVPEQSGEPVQHGQIVLAGPLESGSAGPTGPAGPPGMVRVDHGSDPAVARPDAAIVLWVGSVIPNERDETVDLIAWTP